MRIKVFIIMSFLSAQISFAQDSHISQYYASPIIVNPALTGMFEGDYRAHMHYRNQWKSLVNKPFTTTTLAYDQPYEKRYGLGGYISNNRAGAGGLNFLNAVASAAYEITIDPKNIHNLMTGLQLGIIYKSVNVSNLWFDNQYNNATGTVDPTLSSKENFIKTSVLLPEINIGVYYFYDNPEKDYKPYLGFSGFHMTQPKESFLGYENKLPMRFVAYGGSMINIDENLSINPNFLYMKQAKNSEVQFGAIGYYHFDDSNIKYFFGPYYRNKDAFMIHTGVIYNEYIFRISYDVNVSPLSAITKGRGGIEISFTYTKERGKFIPSLL